MEFKRKYTNNPKPEVPTKPALSKMSSDVVTILKMATVPTPKVIDKRDAKWVLNNSNNSFFKTLKDLMLGSAMHNAIIKGKTKMMAGDGLLFGDAKTEAESKELTNTLTPEQKADLDRFIENPLDSRNIYEIMEKVSYDYQYSGSYCYEVVYNLDFTKIVRIKYVDPYNVAPGKKEGEVIKDYYFCTDWANNKKEEYKPVRIAAFDPNNREDMNQLVYVKDGNLEYFGEPAYQGAITWINIDNIMGRFHEANITNGLSPSMIFKVYEQFPSDEERAYFLHNIKTQLAGENNAGRHMIFFNEDKERMIDVEPVEVNNVDEQYLNLADQAAGEILIGHQVTSPEIFGVAVPGKLGTGDLEQSFRIFDNLVMEFDRQKLARPFNDIFKINGIPLVVRINPFNPLVDKRVDTGNNIVNALNSLSPLVATKVLEAMSSEEIRAIIGLAALAEGQTPSGAVAPTFTINPIPNLK